MTPHRNDVPYVPDKQGKNKQGCLCARKPGPALLIISLMNAIRFVNSRRPTRSLAACFLCLFGTVVHPAEVRAAEVRAAGRSKFEINWRALVSRADLHYRQPVTNPVDGVPLGNGRMGTMVWTTPEAVHFQINRGDVFATNKHHLGPQHGPADYCGGVAKIDISVASPICMHRLSHGNRLQKKS